MIYLNRVAYKYVQPTAYALTSMPSPSGRGSGPRCLLVLVDNEKERIKWYMKAWVLVLEKAYRHGVPHSPAHSPAGSLTPWGSSRDPAIPKSTICKPPDQHVGVKGTVSGTQNVVLMNRTTWRAKELAGRAMGSWQAGRWGVGRQGDGHPNQARLLPS